MKIWIINQYCSLPEHGVHNRHYYFSSFLNNCGFEPVLFIGSSPHNTDLQIIKDRRKYLIDESHNFRTVIVKSLNYHNSNMKRFLSMIQFCLNIISASRDIEKPDIILGSSSHMFNCVVSLILARKLKTKCICEIRDLWPESLIAYNILKRKSIVTALMYRLENWIYSKANSIIFTLEGGTEYVKDKKWDLNNGGSVDLNKIHYINNGIDLDQFYYNLSNYIYWDKFITDDCIKIIYTGSVRKANNLINLLKAVELVNHKDNIPCYKVFIYGNGNCIDELKEYSHRKNLTNVYIIDSIDKKYIPSLLSQADICYLDGIDSYLFDYGISPNKLFEYMAAGKPILSAIKTKYDIIEKNGCGITVCSDPDQLAEGIYNFIKLSEQERLIYGEQSRKTAEQFLYSELTKKLVDVIIKT